MGWIKPVILEIWGLFVDDSAFALAIVAWLCVTAALARFAPGAAGCLALFAGFAALLLQSVIAKSARREG